MWVIRNVKIIDFLWERGLFPVFETGNAAFYYSSYDLHQLLEKYYIHNYCIPNKQGRRRFEPL